MILWWWCWRFYDVGAAKEEDGVLFRCNCIVHAHQRSAHFLPTQNAQINQQPAIAQLWNHSLFSKWFRHRLFSARRKEKPAASNRNQWRKRQKNKSMKRKLPIRWKKSIRKKNRTLFSIYLHLFFASCFYRLYSFVIFLVRPVRPVSHLRPVRISNVLREKKCLFQVGKRGRDVVCVVNFTCLLPFLLLCVEQICFVCGLRPHFRFDDLSWHPMYIRR